MTDLMEYTMPLRWGKKGHEIHADILHEYLILTKYYNTEQLNDALRDAIECLNYVSNKEGDTEE